jgi:FkbM family methyltransferase
MNYIYNGNHYSKVVFDVGANNGSSTIPIAKNEPNTIVFAFEPTPKLIEDIQSQITDIQNYIVTEVAVSNFNGTADFNLAEFYDWGCSSLLEFSDKAQTHWGYDPPFKITNKIKVNVITLKEFIEANNISNIDYLHIDTQGSDLNVLIGMGDYINIVNEGVMEAASSDDILYNGQNTKEQCVSFLESNGFKILNISKNDDGGNELNIHFSKY